MKIGIDARTLKIKGGSEVYARNLINKLDNKKFILFGIDKYKNFKCLDTKIKSDSIFRLIYENFGLIKLIKKEEIGLFHGLKGSIPLRGKFKKIITILDVSPKIYPNYFNFKDMIYWKFILPLSLRRCDMIISISENTGEDITKYFNISRNKIRSIPLGFDQDLFYVKNKKDSIKKIKTFMIKNKLDIRNNKIVLNINTIQPRKNISNLIRAFNVLAKKHHEYVLIIIGKKGWKYQEIVKTFQESNFKDRIYLLDFVPDKLLPEFYNSAELFVYPSLYEGFGLPPLEAMACGCPVITSNTSSLPEVVGDAGIMIDPNNVEELEKQIKRVLTNEKLRKEMIKKGLEQSKKFSWEKCAKETLKVYNEVLKEK